MTIQKVTRDQLAAWRDLKQPHYLYRCYDDSEQLIYIGCSVSPKRRITTHRASKRSTGSVLVARFLARYEVDADVYEGRIAGQAAEAAAIRAERPVFNLQHGGNVIIDHNHRVAQYVLLHTGEELPDKYDSDGYRWGHKIDAASLLAHFAAEAEAAA